MKTTKTTEKRPVSNKYESAINDRDLLGFYEIWDLTLERHGHCGEYEYVANVIHKAFMAELKKRKLVKSRFLKMVRSAISKQPTPSKAMATNAA